MTLSINENTQHNCPIPKEFWWAEGYEALEQDWMSGDFSTWIEKKVHLRAFDVSFDFVELTNLVAAEDRATALREISVVGSTEWIAAREAIYQVVRLDGIINAREAIVRYCRNGTLAARAQRMQMATKFRTGSLVDARIEWDVPLWFWRDFSPDEPPHELWSIDTTFGTGNMGGHPVEITLHGLHFHRGGLALIGVEGLPKAQDTGKAPRGRPTEKFWEPMIATISGQIFRGDLQPKFQADIERAMLDWLVENGKEASESAIRTRARLVWQEVEREDNNPSA